MLRLKSIGINRGISPSFHFPSLQALTYPLCVQTEHETNRLEGKQTVAIVGKKPRSIGTEPFVRLAEVFPVIQQCVFQNRQHEILLRMLVVSALDGIPIIGT